MQASRILRAAAGLAMAAIASGCMVIEEERVDVAPLDGFFPLTEGREYTYCAEPEDGERDCLRVAVSRTALRGADWVRLHPVAAESDAPEEDLLVLFFHAAGIGDLAFMRIEDQEPLLLLTRAETTPEGVRLVIPNCTTQPGNALGAAAAAAGAEADENGCLFADQDSLFAAASALATGGDVPLFGVATIEP